MNMTPDDTLPANDDVRAAEAAPPATAAKSDFDDEELVLPETKAHLNRMGMDTIGCIGCQ